MVSPTACARSPVKTTMAAEMISMMPITDGPVGGEPAQRRPPPVTAGCG